MAPLILKRAMPCLNSAHEVRSSPCGGTFQCTVFCFAATAIAAVVAFAVSMMGGQQVIDDPAHKHCVAAGYTPSTHLYFQCRAQVIQPTAVGHKEAVAR
jgi:hypothetical protein